MKTSKLFHDIIGLPVTDFKVVCGGFLILFLGPYLGPKRSDSKLTGWCLHIDSAWRLDHAETPLLGSLDTCVETKAEAEPALAILRKLQTQTITAGAVGKYIKDIVVYLSEGYKISTFSHSLDGDSWELRCRDGRHIGMSVKDITKLTRAELV
jgi:hypothetical protein